MDRRNRSHNAPSQSSKDEDRIREAQVPSFGIPPTSRGFIILVFLDPTAQTQRRSGASILLLRSPFRFEMAGQVPHVGEVLRSSGSPLPKGKEDVLSAVESV